VLDAGRRLTPAQAVVVGLDAARALDAAHRRGFVHRDIKPANLLFGEDGRLRIADFGLARALSEAAWTEPGDSLVGTARYAAPEQASGSRIDGKADVYALGLVLVEAVTGVVPLTADTAIGTLMGRLDTDVPVPASLGPLRDAVRSATRADPTARPEAGAFGRSLLSSARTLERPDPLPLPGVGDVTNGRAVVHDPTLFGVGLHTATPGDDVVVDDDPVVVAGPGDDRQSTDLRRRWLRPLLAALLVAGVVGAAAAAWSFLRPPSAAVPDVALRPEAEARQLLAAAEAASDEEVDWRIGTDAEWNDSVPARVVIRQEPGAGSRLEDGGQVRLVVSGGPPPRDVPMLYERTEPEARAALDEAELEVGEVVEGRAEDVEPGEVITWSVAGEDRPLEAPRGTAVDLVVSVGAPLRVIPALAEQPLDAVRAQLEGMGLVVEVEEQFSDSVEEGFVVGTDPGPGGEADKGATVKVAVSKGPDLVPVPSVDGLTLAEAVAALRAAGLVPDQVIGPAEGMPFDTDVGEGAAVARGTSVDIFLR